MWVANYAFFLLVHTIHDTDSKYYWYVSGKCVELNNKDYTVFASIQ